jgi:hypothetical protein
MTRYAIGGYEEFPVLHLRPVDDGQGVELPAALYGRWQRARAELDATQRDIMAYIRATAGSEAIPAELREVQDNPVPEDHPSDRAWKLS